MRNLMVTAIASAALGCAAGYALGPDGESDTNAALLADAESGPGQVEPGPGRGLAGGGHDGGPGMRGDRGGRGHGGRPNAGPGPRGGPAGAFAGRGPGGRGQRGPGAAGPGRPRHPATGFDLADLERSLAHTSVELTLDDAQQRAIRDLMQEYRRQMREAILAELTTEQKEKLRAVEAAAAPAGLAEQAAGRNRPER